MTSQEPIPEVRLQALVLADHVYQDRETGKYVIAGTFHQVNVLEFPAALGHTVGLFISLTGLDGSLDLDLEFADGESGDGLMRMKTLHIDELHEPEMPLELAIEIPPLRLEHAGMYQFRLFANQKLLGTAKLAARLLVHDAAS